MQYGIKSRKKVNFFVKKMKKKQKKLLKLFKIYDIITYVKYVYFTRDIVWNFVFRIYGYIFFR